MIKIILFIYICVSLFMALILTEAVMSHERFIRHRRKEKVSDPLMYTLLLLFFTVTWPRTLFQIYRDEKDRKSS